MTKKKDIPLCPYMSNKSYSGNRKPKCSHKHCSKLCIHQNNPNRCDSYKEWFSMKRFDTELPVALESCSYDEVEE